MALIASPRPDSGAALRLRRLCLVALAAAALVTCSGEPTSPGRPGVGTLRVTPYFDAFARLVPLTLDNVRVIVVRPPSDVILTATRSFSPDNQQLTLSLPVLLQSTSEALQVTLELYAGTTLLFTGTSTVQVAAGGTTAPASVPVTYQGPGATLTTLTLAPQDTTVRLGASFPFTATAQDAQQANVPQFYVSWGADNGSIDAAGMFTAPSVRDTVLVFAMTPNGVADTTQVIVTAAPSTLTKVGGDGQSGIVGTRLPQLLAVQVNGSDGLPVPGASVAFTVTTGGGTVDSALATSDAQGIARTGAVLGLTVGPQSFTATVSGIPAAVFTATATGVAPIVVTLAAGGNHTCEIRGGTTLCWGDNSSGQLGDGTTTDRAVPGPISGSFTFTSLAAGDAHTCALTAAGQAFCWGENFSGSLGDGTTNASPTPVAVSGGRTFVALTAGEEFTCGLTTGGQAFCWGLNFDGNLGDGTNTDRLIPTAVTGGLSFTGLDAGVDHTCALTAAGQAFCWGSNSDGQLGDGTQTPRNLPTAVTGGLTFTAIHAGFNFSCGLDTGGAGFCWGFNFGLQLTSPQPVAGGFSYTALAGGDNHICGLTTGGWRCGGDNGSGQLGDGSIIDRVSPVIPSGGFTFTALAGGAQHTCGRTATGTLCWGSNTVGQLGDGSNTDQLTPTLSVGPATTAAVSAGNNQTASAGTAVPIAPAIVVRDALSNPVPGLDVIFAVTSGGGSVTGAVTQTDALGLATVGSWTLGATPGANTLSATVQVGGVGGNPVSFTATGTSPSVLTWNGSFSTDWHTAANWTPALVPTSTQDAIIPAGTPNQPNIASTASTQSLTIQTGATLRLNGSFTFNIFGDFDNAGLINLAGGTPTLDLRGTTRTMQGNTPVATSVSGSYTLTGAVTVNNGFSISGGTSSLTVNGQLLSVSSLSVGSGGSLFMTNTADLVVVTGNVTMGGSDHTGKLTAGQLLVQGNFLQTSGGSVSSFAASGTHSVIMTGVGSSMNFQSPGVAASRFNDLSLGVGASSSLSSRVVVGGSVFTTGTLTLAGRTLEVVGDFVVLQDAGSRLVMTNALDSLLVGGNASFDGADELTFMSAGVLVIGGNLTQQNAISPDAFHPSGTHKTILTSSNPTLSFATPGLIPGSSHFQLLDWSGTGTLTLLSDVYAHGTFQRLGAGASTVAGINHVLDVGGFSAAGPMTFDGTSLRLNMPGGGPLALGSLTFQNLSSTLNQLEVLHPGTGGPFTFTNFSFSSVPSTGRYLLVTDTDGATPDPLTIDMVNPTPATDGGFSQALNGAVINWPATAPGVTWTGTVSTAWTTAGNWSGGAVPTATDDVTIPSGTPFSPVISSTPGTVRDLTVMPGAVLTMGPAVLNVAGSLDAQGSVAGATTALRLTGTGTARGNLTGTFFSLDVNGTYTLSGRLVSPGITINGSLTLAGFTAVVGSSVGDDFSTVNSGVLVMTNPNDSLIVGGAGPSVNFIGGSTVGALTAGVILMNSTGIGAFTQDNTFSDFSYAPSGTHKVVLANASTTLLSMDTPGVGSHFNVLDISAQTGGITLQTTVQANGLLISTPVSTAPAINGGTNRLNAGGGTQITGLTLTNAPMVLSGGSSFQLDNVTFQSMPTSASQLSMGLPGGATPLTFNNLVFSAPPTTGFYVDAADSDGPSPNALTVNLVNPTPATPGLFAKATNGAVINWPASGPIKTWLGATQDWHTTSNWSPAGLPTATDDVLIGSAPNQPILSANATARNLTVQTGFLLNLNGFTLAVTGDVSAPIGTSFVGGGGVLQLNGVGRTLAGNLSVALSVTVNGSYSLTGRTTIGALTVAGTGDLTMGGQTLVSSAVTTAGSGTITMNNALDSVIVSGNATFSGGNTSTRLTAGTFTLAGNLSVTVSGAYQPSGIGAHTTVLNGTSLQTITCTTGMIVDNLDVSAAVGGVRLSTCLVVPNGQLIALPSGPPIVLSASTPGNWINSRGVNVNGLLLDVTNLIVGTLGSPAGTITRFDNVVLQNQLPGTAQLVVGHPGTGAGFTFNNISFPQVPGAGGNYLIVLDENTGDGTPLVVNMVNPSPTTPGGFAQAFNGAVINWPAAAPAVTWTGAFNANWHQPLNWSTGSVPTALDDVTIPSGTPVDPVLASGPAVVGGLTVQSTATLDLGGFTLTVNGLLDATSPGITGAAGSRIVMAGTSVGMRGFAAVDMTITGTTNLSSTFGLTGSLLVQGSLNLNGSSLTVSGNVVTQGPSALIVMQGGGEALIVGGDVTFDGGNQLGFISAGLLMVSGDITQLATHSGDSFHPSGTHTTILTSATPSVSFATPGDVPGTSHFQSLQWSSAGTMTLASDVYTHDAITFGAGFGTNTVISGGNQLSVGRVVMTSALVVFDNTRLVINQPAGALAIDFDHVTFQNMDPTLTQLTVLHTGTGGPFLFSDMTFSTTPSGGGLYLLVTDTDGGAPLTINVANPNPAAPGGFAQAVNGAVINWPAGGPVIVWNGSADADWFNTANWNGGVVPSPTDNVLIPSGMPNYPDAPNIDMNDLTIQLGASLSTSDHTITVGGNLDVSGLISGCCQITMTGTGVTARGNLDGYTFRVEPGAVVSLNGTLGVGGLFNDRIEINGGELVINGNTAVAAELQVFNGGLLTMTDPADLVAIETLSQFAGGDETGHLTSGLLATGDFTQAVGTSAQATSFVASGTHQTVLSGSSPSNVQFQNPGTSHFENLAVGSAAGSVTLNSDVTATGVLNGIGGVVSILAGTPGVTLTAGGAFVQDLIFDGVPLVLSGGPIVGFNTVTFQNMDPAVTQFEVSNDGSGGILSFDGLSFLTTPTTGLYLVVNDLDGPSPLAFTLNLTNATPASPGGFSQANNGAALTWNGVAAGGLSWSGGTSSDWSSASNWSSGSVPTSTDDVVIPAGTPNSPQLSGNSVVGGITLQPGADLDLNGFTLTASGDVDAGNTISGAGTFIAAGAGVTLKGTVATLRITGTAAFSGPAAVTGSLTVDGAGADLNLNGQVATVGGALFVQNNATLTMTAPGGSFSIAGDASFAGASTAGRLTDGVLSVAGSFDQSGADPQSFQASGNHLTVLNGVAPTITFGTPGTGTASRFHRLQISTSGSALMNSRVTVGSNAVISAGALNPAGHTLDVGGDLSTAVTGTLIMQNGADSVIVAGAALFDGGNESGLLTAGVLRTSGLFRQFSSNSPGAFVASGTHTTELAFFNPTTNLILISSPASSGFQNLRILTGVSFSSDIPVKGDLDVQVNSPTNLLGGALVVTGNFNQNGTAFFGPDRLELGGTFARAGAGSFSPDTLILTGLSPQALAFSIPEIVYNTLIVRSDATISGGQVNTLGDVEVQTGGILRVGGNTLAVGGDLGTSGSGVLQMVSATDSVEVMGAATFAGGSELGLLTAGVLNVKGDLTQTSGASNRSYAPTGSHRTRLTGTAPQTVDFAFTGSTGSEPRELTIDNTSPGGVTFTDAHLIFGGVTLNGTSILNALATFNVSGGFTAGPGTTVNATDLGLLSGPLSVAGTFNADTLTAVGLNPIPVLPYKTLRLAQVTSPLAPGAAYSITGSLLLTFGGSLRLNGSSLNVAGDLIVGTSGNLIMDDPADVLSVTGDATFDGADETGKLTAGVLRVGGNFTQDSTTSTLSFLSTGTNLVLDGSGPQSVSFASSAVSKLAGFTIAKTAGTVDILTDVPVGDSLLVSSATTVQGAGQLRVTRKVITAAASTLATYNLGAIPDSMQIAGTFAVFQANFGAGTTIPTLPYRQLVIYAGDLAFAGPASIDTALIIVSGSRLTLPAGGNVNGRVLVTNASQLVLGPAMLTVKDSLSIGVQSLPGNGGGTIVMQDPATVLDVGRNVYFEGGNSTGLMTAGILKVGGDFVVSNVISPLAFVPSGTHTTAFTNTAPTMISLPVGSRFQNLDLSATTGGVTLNANTIADQVISTNTSAMLIGGGNSLTMRRALISGLTVDNASLLLDEAGTAVAQQFDNVSFQNLPTSGALPLSVTAEGAGTPRALTFSAVNFPVLPVGAGNLYVKLTSSNGQGVALTMAGSDRAVEGPAQSDPPNGTTVNGAQVLWTTSTLTGQWVGTYSFGSMSADLTDSGGIVTGQITDQVSCVYDVSGTASGLTFSLPTFVNVIGGCTNAITLTGTLSADGQTATGNGDTSGIPWTFTWTKQ